MDDFNLEKLRLRSYYKRLKAGLVQYMDIPFPYRYLLAKYYFRAERPLEYARTGKVMG